jgi:spore maturation protein CgeB
MSTRIVICGLAITSSWGNGHATTYRALVRALGALGHDVTFLERDLPWYRDNRDAPAPEGCRVGLYASIADLVDRWGDAIADADAVVVGSYVPDGVAVGELVTRTARGVTAFYDIDTPVTLRSLARGEHAYLTPALVRRYDVYLSFTGGPTLEHLERDLGARRARPLYCSVDPERYAPMNAKPLWELGYLGTWSADRQPSVDRFLLEVARRRPERQFAIGGPSYPDTDAWPANVTHMVHVSPPEHPAFYGRQRFTLNVTRADMIAAGWSPSVRLFEAAACGVPIVSDAWPGLESFFVPGKEILLVRDTEDVLGVLEDTTDERRGRIAAQARARVLAAHTARHRAQEMLAHLREAAQ